MTIHSSSSPDRKLWLAALKPPMYSVAMMPILVGSVVAYWETQRFNPKIFIIFLASAVLVLAWENLSNDVFDADTGIDVNKPHSLVNLTGSRRLIFWLGSLCLGLGMGGILGIALWQRDATVLGLVSLCCFLGYLYQGPPFRLGYQGLGEILCFFSFGPLGVGAAYYSQAQAWSLSSQLAGIVVSIPITLVLFCSHFHQVNEDLAAGKRSPIVRLGTKRGAALVPVFCAITLGLGVLAVIPGYFPMGTLLLLGSLPAAVRLSRHVSCFHAMPQKISNAKFHAISFQFWSGALLGLGFLLPWG